MVDVELSDLIDWLMVNVWPFVKIPFLIIAGIFGFIMIMWILKVIFNLRKSYLESKAAKLDVATASYGIRKPSSATVKRQTEIPEFGSKLMSRVNEILSHDDFDLTELWTKSEQVPFLHNIKTTLTSIFKRRS